VQDEHFQIVVERRRVGNLMKKTSHISETVTDRAKVTINH